MTSDEVVERIKLWGAAKKTKKRKGKGKQSNLTSAKTALDDIVVCESCGQVYSDDEAENWIGCDACESWWHFWCAGLVGMLTENDERLRENCLSK